MTETEWIEIIRTIPAIVAAVYAMMANRSVHKVHLSINSRMDELLTSTNLKAHDNGFAEGQKHAAAQPTTEGKEKDAQAAGGPEARQAKDEGTDV
jgi:hypothetical protein